MNIGAAAEQMDWPTEIFRRQLRPSVFSRHAVAEQKICRNKLANPSLHFQIFWYDDYMLRKFFEHFSLFQNSGQFRDAFDVTRNRNERAGKLRSFDMLLEIIALPMDIEKSAAFEGDIPYVS
ncbi:hypothetical protein EBMC1_12851 [Sphingopyxis sp. MC1]|nr:hypothetical protein EBMC1_12851 [Sphingopyxis sp. MC1]